VTSVSLPGKPRRLTDLQKILLAWVVGFTLAGAYAAGRYVPAAGWTTSDVTTGASAGYPDLQPRVYDSSVENTTVLAAAVASRLPRWKVAEKKADPHTVTCTVAEPIGFLIDDVEIHIEPAGPDQRASRVVIHSHSRRGGGDLGENARHIRALQAAMDDRLPLLIP